MLKVMFYFALMALSALSTITAQSPGGLRLSGTIEPLPANETLVVIFLYQSGSSEVFRTTQAEADGSFGFSHLAPGIYALSIKHNSETLFEKNGIDLRADTDLGIIGLQTATELSEVVISNAKPYIERRDGIMILNVDSHIGATGSSAFEVLEKAPGVGIDNNDNISLRGKGGVIVQLDGKPSPLTGSNLANYLRGIPSGSIEKIEFISNPGAKYDASGTAIINIRFKKDRKKGTNGSISSSYGQGIYPKSNSSLSLNHRNNNLNVFGSYSFAYREGFNQLILEREFYENGNFNGAYLQDNWLKMNFRNHIGRVGADYQANSRHTFGVVGSAVSNRFNPTGHNTSDVLGADHQPASSFETFNNSRDDWHNYAINLNHRFVIDTTGTELTTDFDYARYGNTSLQKFRTDYYRPDMSPLRDPYLLLGDIMGGLYLYSLKSDYTKTFGNKLKLDAGAKSSYVKADNDLQFYDRSSGVPVFDPAKSNHFIYTENINAAYVNVSHTVGKWGYHLGIRVENTRVSGLQLVDDTSFENSYTQLFPSVLGSYAVNPKNSLELNYSRRISRPGYEQLNPFKFFLDPTTYKEGNPYLKPQTTHSIDLTHIYNQKIHTTLNFSRTTDNITEVIAPSDDDQQLTVQTSRNLDNFDIFGLFMTVPVDVTNWWSCNNSLNMYYGSYSGTVANTTLSNRGNFTYNANTVNSFKLGNGYTSEVSAHYRAREIYAFLDVSPIWHLNLAAQKKFKNSSVLKIACNDIFFSNRVEGNTAFRDYKEHFDVQRDTRSIVVSYTYNFGNSQPSGKRRAGGADDIKQRINSTNG